MSGAGHFWLSLKMSGIDGGKAAFGAVQNWPGLRSGLRGTAGVSAACSAASPVTSHPRTKTGLQSPQH